MADDIVETAEPSLDDVAATLLVKPEPAPKPKQVVAKTPVEAPDEEADTESQDENGSAGEEGSAPEDDTGTTAEAGDEDEDVELDDIDIDLTVDGEAKKVKLKDLKANYSGNQAIEKRLQEATEAKTHAVRANQVLFTALNEEAIRLKKIDEILVKLAEPEEINWEELRNTNLPRYLLERDKQREANDRRGMLQAEQTRIHQQQQEIAYKAQLEYTQNEAKQLVSKIPDFAEPAKAQAMFAKMTSVGKEYGFAPEEISGVIDHRMMLVLRDAMRYKELMSKQKAVTTKPAVAATTLLRPTAKNNKPSNLIKKAQEKAVAKARASGRIEDVAATLIMGKR